MGLPEWVLSPSPTAEECEEAGRRIVLKMAEEQNRRFWEMWRFLSGRPLILVRDSSGWFSDGGGI